MNTEEITVFVILLVLACLYLMPTFICFGRRTENQFLIFFVNVCLGWTLLGWVGCIIWASLHPKQFRQPVYYPPVPNPISRR
jgi:hypothetical protein